MACHLYAGYVLVDEDIGSFGLVEYFPGVGDLYFAAVGSALPIPISDGCG
jgi:hypothetical protein